MLKRFRGYGPPHFLEYCLVAIIVGIAIAAVATAGGDDLGRLIDRMRA